MQVVYGKGFFKESSGPRMFVNLDIIRRDTGYLKEQRGGHAERPAQAPMLQIEEGILEMIEDDPTMSTRAIAAQVIYRVWKTTRQ